MPAVTKEEVLRRIVGAGGEALLLPVEEMEHLLNDVRGTLALIEAKKGRIQGEFAAAARGRRRAPHGRRAAEVDAPPAAYTRKGAGAVRKRLKAQAGDAKKEKERLEALLGGLQEAVADARQRAALPWATTAA